VGADRVREPLGPDRAQLGGVRLAEGDEPLAALGGGAELGMVALAHTREEVEVGRVGGADAGDRGGGGAAVGEERGAGERVRTAARAAVGREALGAQRVEDRRDVGRAVGDAAAGMWRGASVARPVVADQPQAELLRRLDLGAEQAADARRAVMGDDRGAVGIPGLEDGEGASVGRRDAVRARIGHWRHAIRAGRIGFRP
jgi:hypothetical protein